MDGQIWVKFYWKALNTDATGKGSKALHMTRGMARDTVKQMNQEYDGIIHHWYEVVPEPDEAE